MTPTAGPAVPGSGVACLRAFEAMEVQQHGDRVPLAPFEEVLQVCQLSGDEWRCGEDHPVAEWNPHSIDPAARQPSNVILCDPSGPMALHPGSGHLRAKGIHQAVLIQGDTRSRERPVARPIVEEPRSHPFFQEEPVPQVHTPNHGSQQLVASNEQHLPECPARSIGSCSDHLDFQHGIFGFNVHVGHGRLECSRLHVPPFNP
mmetsp:Transcript_37832/g.87862  ORF Transcript_37832/g.87862 Transcript_37832/m.87862 type:complete len:203 (-) Transcript_37832:83-691(-)